MGVLTGSWKRVCELAIIGSCKNVSRLMISLIRLVVSVASIAVILSGCTFTIGGDPVEKEVATDTGTATEAESVAKEPAAEELTSSQITRLQGGGSANCRQHSSRYDVGRR